MADVFTLSELDPLKVDESIKLLQQMLQDRFPTLDLSPSSVLYQLLVRPAGLYHAVNQENWERRRLSLSPQALATAETPDDEAADTIASNWNIQRRNGTAAAGSVLLIFSSKTYVPLPSSTTFSCNGVDFRPTQGFAAVPDASYVVDGTQLVLSARSDGTYVVSIPLQAVNTGSAGNVGNGSHFTVTPALADLVDVIAYGDFSGGADQESTQALVARLASGIVAEGSGGRGGLKGLLMRNFPAITDVSVIGAGDPELLRSAHTGLGVRAAGLADVYVRCRPRAQLVSVLRTATLTDLSTATWHMDFDRDEYPGMYGIERVLPTNAAVIGTNAGLGFTVLRGMDSSAIEGVEFTPRMQGNEVNFSRYQTIGVTFQDVDAGVDGLSLGSTRQYQVDLIYMPDLAIISDWLLNRERRPWGGDYLVKAAVPCLVSTSIKIIRHLGDPDLASNSTLLGQIRTAIADAVNAMDFSEGRLPASLVINAAQELLPRRTRVQTPIDLRGQVFLPDGTRAMLYDKDVLVAPNRPEVMCTARTMAFMCDPSSVSISVENGRAA